MTSGSPCQVAVLPACLLLQLGHLVFRHPKPQGAANHKPNPVVNRHFCSTTSSQGVLLSRSSPPFALRPVLLTPAPLQLALPELPPYRATVLNPAFVLQASRYDLLPPAANRLGFFCQP